MRTSPKDAGFTLVEVLISLFIFALISAGTMGAMLQTFAAKDRLNLASAELADIAAFRSILRADMNALTLRPMRDGVGGTENYLVTTQNPEENSAILTFSRLGRPNPAGAQRGQVERVRYLFRDGQFIRESLSHENPAQREGWTGRVLLEGIEDIDVTYHSILPFQTGQPVDLRLEEWTILKRLNGLPKLEQRGAVEFKLTDIDGTETVHLFEVGS
ncbi:MAG: type II secretion system protein GspJ [Litorimonas sp.]